ncbi:hypothetical protein VTJ83DRAFT_6982 [Remersonia thermophila]|uniref:Ankyrin n=1 Tax=Remersonia thermophila TaxID=72144 RepID=A0ABR4D679_9PEZI
MVQFLLERGADPRRWSSLYGSSLLSIVAHRAPAQLVEYVCDELGFEVTDLDHEQRNAFHLVFTGSVMLTPDKVEWLCERVDDISQMLGARDAHGRLPLHLACGRGTLDKISPLLKGPLKDWVNELDNDGWTPLHWACRHWDVVIVKILIEAGADPDFRTHHNMDAWDIAVLSGNRDFASFLGKDPGAPSSQVPEEKHKNRCNSCLACRRSTARDTNV